MGCAQKISSMREKEREKEKENEVLLFLRIPTLLFLLVHLSSLPGVRSYLISRRCTRTDLSGRKVTMVAGEDTRFFLQIYPEACDFPPCHSITSDFSERCGGCPSCQIIRKGSPVLNKNRPLITVGIFEASQYSVRAPGSTCSVNPYASPDGFPGFCRIESRFASNFYQYILRFVVTEPSNPDNLGYNTDPNLVESYGAVVRLVAGKIHVPSCTMSLTSSTPAFSTGDVIGLRVQLMDAYGNIVGANTGRYDLSFPWILSLENAITKVRSVLEYSILIDTKGYHIINFKTNQAGSLNIFLGNNREVTKGSPIRIQMRTGRVFLPLCSGDWLGGLYSFVSGDLARFQIRPVDSANIPTETTIEQLQLKVLENLGTKSTAQPITFTMQQSPGLAIILFTPTVSGNFLFYVGDDASHIPGSPFAFTVIPGPVSIPHCIGVLSSASVIAGNHASIIISLRDRLGNLITSAHYADFIVTVWSNGRQVDLPNILKSLISGGSELVTFMTTKSGIFSIRIGSPIELIKGAPFLLNVKPGPVSIPTCAVVWKSKLTKVEAGQSIFMKIQQTDINGNQVPTPTPFLFEIKILEDENQRGKLGPSVVRQYDSKIGLQTLEILFTQARFYWLQIGRSSQNISGSPFPISIIAGALKITSFSGLWVTPYENIVAGTQATFRVTHVDMFGNNVSLITGKGNELPKLNALVSIPLRNGSFLNMNLETKVVSDSNTGTSLVTFNPRIAGAFMLRIHGIPSLSSKVPEEPISGSPFSFKVVAGPVSTLLSEGYWMNSSSIMRAGDEAFLEVRFKDDFNNSIMNINFKLQAYILRKVDAFNIQPYETKISVSSDPYKPDVNIISFTSILAGDFYLDIKLMNKSMRSSPFLFSVHPGPSSIKNCLGKFENNTNEFQTGNLVKLLITESDAFGNEIPANSPSRLRNLEIAAKVILFNGLENVQISDFTTIPPSVDGFSKMMLTFTAPDIGKYLLEVKANNVTISGSPFQFNVVEGSVNASLSSFEGPGLLESTAGTLTYFVIKLRDSKGNSTGSHVNSLTVQIFMFGGNTQINTTLSAIPKQYGNYNVTYTPKISGKYVIMSRWSGNPIGGPQYMTVEAGSISISSCSGSWENQTRNFQIGQTARLIIAQRDAIGNGVYSKGNSTAGIFKAQVYRTVGMKAIFTPDMSITLSGDMHQLLTFQIWEVGKFVLQVGNKNENISGSPFSFACIKGSIGLPQCTGDWENGNNAFESGTTARFIISCGQDVSATNLPFNPLSFKATVYDSSQKNIMSTPDLIIEKTKDKSMENQLLRFSLQKHGTYWLLVENAIYNLTDSPFRFSYHAGPLYLEKTIGYWKDGVHDFNIGSMAAFIIQPRDRYGNLLYDKTLDFQAYQTDVDKLVPLQNFTSQPLFDNDTEYQLVSFSLQVAGTFSLYVGNLTHNISGSPFTFSYFAGYANANASLVTGEAISPLASINFPNNIHVLMKDSFGNPATLAYESLLTVKIMGPSGLFELQNFTNRGYAMFDVSYKPPEVGTYNINVYYDDVALTGSPFVVPVGSGWVSASSCTASIILESGVFAVTKFSVNVNTPESGILAGTQFSVNVTTRHFETGLPYPTQNIRFDLTPLPFEISTPPTSIAKRASDDSYSSSFTIYKKGSYKIDITAYGSPIRGSPYSVQVKSGYISPKNCIASGTGLENRKAGQEGQITVTARDVFGNLLDSLKTKEGSPITFLVNLYGPKNTSLTLSYIGNSVFSDKVVMQISGTYNISILSNGQNIRGSPFKTIIFAGNINVSRSTYSIDIGYRFLAGVPGTLTIQARDALGNICNNGEPGFHVAFSERNTRNIYSGVPFENTDGTYTFNFKLNKVATYNINVTYKGLRVLGETYLVVVPIFNEEILINNISTTMIPTRSQAVITLYGQNLLQALSISCIFGNLGGSNGTFNETQKTLQCHTPYTTTTGLVKLEVQLFVYQGKLTYQFNTTYYVDFSPVAVEDRAWTWENQSVNFNVLTNDIVSLRKPILTGFCQEPKNGSAVVAGGLLKYSPNPNFFGTDSFVYKIVDFKGRSANGNAVVSVYKQAPHFHSFPAVITGIEDSRTPALRDAEIINPNIAEILTIDMYADHGHLQPSSSVRNVQIISYDKNVGSVNNTSTSNIRTSLRITGLYISVNAALKYIDYIGDINFNGNDLVHVSVVNKGRKGHNISVLAMLQAINDPPFINMPSQPLYITTSKWLKESEHPLVGIYIGDPDQNDTRENGESMELTVNMEITARSLKVVLDISNISRASFKAEGSNKWIPLPGDNKKGIITVSGQKIQFRSTIENCNKILHSLAFVRGSKKGLPLSFDVHIRVDDEGSYGCFHKFSTGDNIKPLSADGYMSIKLEKPRSDIKKKLLSSIIPIGLISLYILIRVICHRHHKYAFKDGDANEEDQIKNTLFKNPAWIMQVERLKSFDFTSNLMTDTSIDNARHNYFQMGDDGKGPVFEGDDDYDGGGNDNASYSSHQHLLFDDKELNFLYDNED